MSEATSPHTVKSVNRFFHNGTLQKQIGCLLVKYLIHSRGNARVSYLNPVPGHVDCHQKEMQLVVCIEVSDVVPYFMHPRNPLTDNCLPNNNVPCHLRQTKELLSHCTMNHSHTRTNGRPVGNVCTLVMLRSLVSAATICLPIHISLGHIYLRLGGKMRQNIVSP
ncbi:hypothetical protein ACTXT7_007879 [Hymenolepis weldensis]